MHSRSLNGQVGKLMDALAIRDTNAHNAATPLTNATSGSLLFFAQNSCNQDVSLKYQGSFDGTNWVDLASAATVTATTGTDKQTLTDPWPYVRCVATCSVAPASGSLTVNYSWREAR